MMSAMSGQPISGHKGRDRWMCTLAAASDLSTMAMRLALRLCVSFNCKTGQCDPGYPKLAEDMAVSKRTVSRAIDELETAGWVSVDRTGGDNTRNAQINLLIPGAGKTRSDDNMVSPEKEPTGATSGDNILSPENPSLQVTENAPSVDRKAGFQVTDSVAAQKNLITCEPEIAAEGGGYHTSRADRESASNSSTSDDETPSQRASHEALNDHLASQNSKPSIASKIDMRPPANGANGRAAPDASPFAQVLSVYPEDRVGNEANAYWAFERALDARGSLNVVLEDIASLMQDYGDDVPFLIDILKTIERMP